MSTFPDEETITFEELQKAMEVILISRLELMRAEKNVEILKLENAQNIKSTVQTLSWRRLQALST